MNLPDVGKTARRLRQGLVLGMGAGLGWAVICTAFDLWTKAEASYQALLFGYVTLGSMASFGVFGYVVGRHEQRFAELSLVDHLTRLYNTRHFHETLKAEFSNAQRYTKPLTLILLDLDHFKQVNDTWGHPAGDKVLKIVAQTVAGLVRQGDTVARVGGEEFAVVLPNTDAEGGFRLAERIRNVIKQHPVAMPDGSHITVRVSLGVAELEHKAVSTATEFFAIVDQALYEAKEAGRDRTVVATKRHEKETE